MPFHTKWRPHNETFLIAFLHHSIDTTYTRCLRPTEPTIAAHDIGTIADLLQTGANPDAVADGYHTPLTWTIERNEDSPDETSMIRVLKVLLAAGADPNKLDELRMTPLQTAIEAGKIQAVRFFA